MTQTKKCCATKTIPFYVLFYKFCSVFIDQHSFSITVFGFLLSICVEKKASAYSNVFVFCDLPSIYLVGCMTERKQKKKLILY